MTTWSRSAWARTSAIVVAVTVWVTADLMAQKRVITHEDVWLMHRVGDPGLSPDGRHAVFSVTEPAYDGAQTMSDLWIVPTDGSSAAAQADVERGCRVGRRVLAGWQSAGVHDPPRGRRGRSGVHAADRRRRSPAPDEPAVGASSPKFRPDGRAILVETMLAGTRSIDEHRAPRRNARAATPPASTTRFRCASGTSISMGGSPRSSSRTWDERGHGRAVRPLRGTFNPTGRGESRSRVDARRRRRSCFTPRPIAIGRWSRRRIPRCTREAPAARRAG